MRIAIIGTGRMGRGFAQALSPRHEVIVGPRDLERARATASKTRAAAGATYADAAADADVVIAVASAGPVPDAADSPERAVFETLALARRLAAPLDAAIRLAIQETLAAAAEEITVELVPGSVELRLRARDPRFVVTMPPPVPEAGERADDDDALSPFASPAG